MNRVRLLVLSIVATFALIAIGGLAFGWASPSVTEFILMAFIGAWCGDQDAAMSAGSKNGAGNQEGAR